MSSVIISEEKVIELGKLCLSNLRNFVNDEYLLTYNDVKRLRTLFFLACQKVFYEKELCDEKELCEKFWEAKIIVKKIKIKYEKLDEKYWEAYNIIKKTKIENEKIKNIFFTSFYNNQKKSLIEDNTKIEKVFETPVIEEYSRKKFSLEETYRIFDFIKDGLYNCNEYNEDLYYQIKDFKNIYYVYNGGYNSLVSNYIFK